MIPKIVCEILSVVFFVSYYLFRLFVWIMRAAFGDRNCMLAVADLAGSATVERAAADAGVSGGLQRVRTLLAGMLEGAPEPSVTAPDEQPKGDF